MFDKLLDILLLVADGNFVYAAVVIMMFVVLFRLNVILEFFESRKRSRIARIKNALSDENVRGVTRNWFEDEVENEYFRLDTGLNLNQKIRERIIRLTKNSNGALNVTDFGRAGSYVKYSDHEIKIVINKIDIIFEKIFSWFSLLFFVFAALVFARVLIAEPTNWVAGLLILFSSLILFVVEVETLTRPIQAAKRIKMNIDSVAGNEN